ncbi:MAG TPA: hypothetical protein PLI45_04305 [Candidatus Woesebacteria bacterium]|nr:hypothetical protein [Candidatus Woesebacteria bacterium]
MSNSFLSYHEGVYCPRCQKYVATIVFAKPVYIQVDHRDCDFRVDLKEYIGYYLGEVIKGKFFIDFDDYAFDKILFLVTADVKAVSDAFAEIQKRTNHFFQKLILFSDTPQLECPLCDHNYFESRPERLISEGQCEKGHFVFNKDKYLLKILQKSGYKYKEIKGDSAYEIFLPKLFSSIKIARIDLGYSKKQSIRTLKVSPASSDTDHYLRLISTLFSYCINRLFEVTKV